VTAGEYCFEEGHCHTFPHLLQVFVYNNSAIFNVNSPVGVALSNDKQSVIVIILNRLIEHIFLGL
jgi:hypothetical protein